MGNNAHKRKDMQDGVLAAASCKRDKASIFVTWTNIRTSY